MTDKKHEDHTSDAHTVIVVCGTRGGSGYVVSDASGTVAEAVESARRYGGTARTKGYTAYEFGPGVTYTGHDPLNGVHYKFDDPDNPVDPTVTERNRFGAVKEVTRVPGWTKALRAARRVKVKAQA